IAAWVMFLIYFWGSVASRLGRNFWLYGLTIWFFALPILFLAFDETAQPVVRDHVPSRLALCGVSGELAYTNLPVPGDGLYIGRNPARANLVLSSSQISNVHARVWPDA